jgi:hypothetical protein
VIWFKDHIVVPKDAKVRQQILDEAHLSRYSIHPASTKMYQDLKQHYWWTKMKIEIARYVAKCDNYRCVKEIHMKAAGPLQPCQSQPGNGKITIWISLWDYPGQLKDLTLLGS